jgi:hypothetical protein
MVTKLGIVPIYPTGRGHFALGSPDGDPLFPGDSLTILLADYQITGTIQVSDQGDYLQLPDGGRCGLCACMKIVALPSEISLVEQIRAAYYDTSKASELRLARLTKKAMETMSDEEWSALCVDLGSGVTR